MSVDNITLRHVLDAVDKIEREGVVLEPSKRYDVIIRDKNYPPKEVMRYANLIANGVLDWPYSGGESTNRFLERLGFAIVSKENQPNKSGINNQMIKLLKGMGKENATHFFDNASILLEKLNVQINDSRITFSTRNNKRLVIIIGQRYCYAYIPNEKFPWQFIHTSSSSQLQSVKVTKYDGNPEAYYHVCLEAKAINLSFEGLLNASTRELKRTNLSGFRRSNDIEFEKLVLDRGYRNQLFDQIFVSKDPLTGNVWKLGCIWGSGEPSFYNFIKEHSIVLGLQNRLYSIGDLIMITSGHTVLSLGRILEAPIPSIDFPEFEKDFSDLKIDYTADVNIAKVEWYELSEEEVFTYPLQTGICKVHEPYSEQALSIWRDRFVNYWIFQGNPLEFDYEKAVGNNLLTHWTVTAHKDKIKINDKVIVWLTGKRGGCYALARVTSNPVESNNLPNNPLWKSEPKVTFKAGIELTHNLIDSPLYTQAIKSIQGLEDLKAGNQGTNFSATRKQFYALLKLVESKNEKMYWNFDLSLNTILYGPPGTGKTYTLNLYKNKYFVDDSQNRFKLITFHQKYSYEDFIEGIKPLLREEKKDSKSGELQFELKRGIFYNSCLSALQLVGYSSFQACYMDTPENRKEKFLLAKNNPSMQFALFIDEINRANISAVFGELITLLEDDKRIGGNHEMWLELPYSNEYFSVPGNLYVVGTMNTADRSIALLDIALRRRFEFKSLYPEYHAQEWWSPLLKSLNEAIYSVKNNPDFFIGHAFFINKPESDRAKILNTKIIPLLSEYFQNNANSVKSVLNAAGVAIKSTGIHENFQVIAE